MCRWLYFSGGSRLKVHRRPQQRERERPEWRTAARGQMGVRGLAAIILRDPCICVRGPVTGSLYKIIRIVSTTGPAHP
eukprot:6824532-Prymnesium_polylepis.1